MRIGPRILNPSFSQIPTWQSVFPNTVESCTHIALLYDVESDGCFVQLGKHPEPIRQLLGKTLTPIVWMDCETPEEDAPLDKVGVNEGGLDLICVIEEWLALCHFFFGERRSKVSLANGRLSHILSRVFQLLTYLRHSHQATLRRKSP